MNEVRECAPTANIAYGDVRVTLFGVNKEDHIFRHCQSTGSFYELDLLARTRSFVGEGDFVVDVGANIGNHSVFWAAICGAHVLAIEPSEECFAALNESIVENSLEDKIFPRQFALGAEAGSGTVIPGASTNVGQSRVDITSGGPVSVKELGALSEVADRTVDVLKIDVEGMELDVLKGSMTILERDRPLIFCECLTRDSRDSVEDALSGLGYSMVDVFNYSPTYLFAAIGGDIDLRRGDDSSVELRRSVSHLVREFVEVKSEVRALSKELSRLSSFVRESGEQA